MINLFEYVDKFFASLQGYNINYNICFITFIGLFLLVALGVAIATSHSYESKLTKAVDFLNNYFLQNPNINEENLVAFNNKMKSKKVPKQLRKHWQQFVLYREDKASSYMSFNNCVTKPMQNSSFKRSIQVMNVLSSVFAICAFVFNLYLSYEANLVVVLQKSIVTPAIILVLNLLLIMFLNFRHNAIVSDLFQNYQYFEVNIDKATKTLPEYVDYEVLFDKNEIKRGIPILYTYLQKRAEEEQRELELARLKNIEHEKFNFDEAGVAGSLVLERAMQEAENYIAERKKYNQDTEQINSDITQEDMNYREITKEYNRQMQVSKETFANFKSQLEEASSSIEANYIKKQQQQELDRQRNLERDFDTATERHKKIIESFHAELDNIDQFRAKSRKALEDAMMSEFDTYGGKVYNEAKKAAEEREKEKYAKIQQQIQDLEEKLVVKEQELEKVYNENQMLCDKLDVLHSAMPVKKSKKDKKEVPDYKPLRNIAEQPKNETVEEFKPLENFETYQSVNNFEEQPVETQEVQNFEPEEQPDQTYQPLSYEAAKMPSYMQDDQHNLEYQDNKSYTTNEETNNNNAEENVGWEDEGFIYGDDKNSAEIIKDSNLDKEEDVLNDFETFDDQPQNEDEENDEGEENGALEYDSYEDDELEDELWFEDETEEDVEEDEDSNFFENKNISTNQNESEMSGVTKRGPGRPRKLVDESAVKEKRKPGRPRKTEETKVNQPKRKAGRPRKVAEAEVGVIRKPGRPRKTEDNEEVVKRSVGRPRKELTTTETTSQEKRGRGRPRKDTNAEQFNNINDIDAYLKEIDSVIAQENAKFEASKKELEKKASLKNRR